MKYLYNLYVYLVAAPILIFLTGLTAVITIVFFWCPNAKPIHWIQAAWSKAFFYNLLLPVEVEGYENIQPNQSYIFVANHQSMLDVWLIYGWLPVIFKWMMKKELRYIPFVGSACKAAGHVYVDRSNPRAALKSMEEIKKTLQNGACTVIFPEGTRCKDGKLAPFKRGAFKIALEVGLPVIPLSISGCYKVKPKDKWMFTRNKVKLHIGKPIDLTIYSKEQENEAIADVRDAVAQYISED